MKNLLKMFVLLSIYTCTNAQKPMEYQLVGAPCEGCEAVLEADSYQLKSHDTLPYYLEGGKPIKITGQVFKADGQTPAAGIIIYAYHTNQEGYYHSDEKEIGWGQRHGSIRGWVKTDERGRYSFLTSRAQPYPNRDEPAHVHYTILETSGKYYYVADTYFEGDSLLTQRHLHPKNPRGGYPGVIKLEERHTHFEGTRNFILGKNIPSYD